VKYGRLTVILANLYEAHMLKTMSMIQRYIRDRRLTCCKIFQVNLEVFAFVMTGIQMDVSQSILLCMRELADYTE
jgi:hypothetical protein